MLGVEGSDVSAMRGLCSVVLYDRIVLVGSEYEFDCGRRDEDGDGVNSGNDLNVTTVSISEWTRVAPSLLGCP